MRFRSDGLFDAEPDKFCHFGITAGIAAAVLPAIEAAGVGASVAGPLSLGVAGGLEGAAGGALLGKLTGGSPLKGALTGALTGGATAGLGPVLGEATGLGATAGSALAGAGAGALGAEITGQSPLTGAATGGALGLATGALGGSGTSSTSVTSTPATGISGGTGAASTAPASIAAPTGGPAADLTATPAVASGGGPSVTPVSSLASPGGSTVGPTDLLASPDFGSSSVSQSATPLAPGVADKITGGGGASSGTGIGGFLAKNPSLLLGAGTLGLSALRGSTPLPAEGQLQTAAGEASTMANTLSSYQLTGRLPPGLQSVVDRHQENAVAGIKSKYASLGLSGSTSEVEAINGVKQTSSTEVAQIADGLAQQGIRWETLSSQDIDNLLKAQQARDDSFTKALSSFAAGLGGASLKAA